MSDRPSRQDLVVAPKRSNLGIILGAVASAGLGFAAVWLLGIGQTRGPQPDAMNLPVTTVGETVIDPDLTFRSCR